MLPKWFRERVYKNEIIIPKQTKRMPLNALETMPATDLKTDEQTDGKGESNIPLT